MKILLVHNSYQQPGGEDQVFAQEAELLQSNGHQVSLYRANNDQLNAANRLTLLANTIWNRAVAQDVQARIHRERPDVVHVHNTFPVISPAVYYAAQAEGVPVVQTLHNYRLLCPAATLFRDGHVCEECVHKTIPWPGVVHSCYRDSRLATAAGAAMLAAHNYKQTWKKAVSAYIALTGFARRKFVEGGLPSERIVVKPNFLQIDPGLGAGRGNYALFVGRLTPEKGITTLLSAWQTLSNDLSLKIAGDGPQASLVEEACRHTPRIEWLKWLPRTGILELMKDATVLILPSTWYEGFPMILAEAFAVGLPVITSNLGSMASIVEHRQSGLHFEPGNASSLIEQVRWFLMHPDDVAAMRVKARAEYAAKYTAQANYAQLLSIYDSVMSSS